MTTEGQIGQQPTPPDTRLSPKDFAARIKEKYPEYKDVDDSILTQKIIDKYPQYKESVNFEQPKPEPNPIDLSLQHHDLKDKTIELPSANLGVGSGAASIEPDVNARKQAEDISTQVKAKGFDPEKLYNTFHDVPQSMYDYETDRGEKPLSKENLLQQYKTNPEETERKVKDYNTQFHIIDAAYNDNLNRGYDEHTAKNLAIAEGNKFIEANHIYDNTSDAVASIQTKKDQIDKNLQGEEKDNAIQRLQETDAKYLSAPTLLNDYKTSEFKDLLDPNQYAGLQTLKMFHPEVYDRDVAILKAGTNSEYKQDAGFDPMTGEFSSHEIETDQSVNQKRGMEKMQKELADIGRENTLRLASQKLTEIQNQYTNATPEEKQQLQNQWLSYSNIAKATVADYNKDKERYPYTEALKQQQLGWNPVEYGVYRFGKGLESSLRGIQTEGTSLFGSDTDKSRLQMQGLGENAEEAYVNQLNKTPLHKIMGATGDIFSIAAQTAGLNAMGATKLIANATPLFLTTLNQYYKQGTEQGMGYKQANEYALTHSLVTTLAGLINPDYKIVKQAFGGASVIGKELSGITEDTWNKIISQESPIVSKFKNAIGSTAAFAAKNAAVWNVGVPIANDLADKYVFNQKISNEDIGNHVWNELKGGANDMIAINSIHFLTHFRNVPIEQKQLAYSLGIHPDITKEEIENQVQRGEITRQVADKRIEAVDKMASIVNSVPDINKRGEPLTQDQKVKWAYNLLLKSKIADAKKDAPEAQKESLKAQSDKIDNQNNTILNRKGDEQEEEKAADIPQPKTLLERGSQELVEAAKNGEIKNPFYTKIALNNPEQHEALLKEIAQQAHGQTADEVNENKIGSAEYAMKGQYPSSLINIAKELFPKEKSNNVSVIQPEDNKAPNIINLQSDQNAISEPQSSQIPIQPTQENSGAMGEGNTGHEIATEQGNGQPPTTQEGGNQTQTEGEKPTGVKKAITSAVRAEHNLPEVNIPKMGSDADELYAAKQRVDSGQSNPRDLVNRILTEKTGYKNEDEIVDMQYYAHQLSAKETELRTNLSEADNDLDKSHALGQLQQLSDELDRQTEAAQRALNQWGRIGNRAQPVIDSGFNPVRERGFIKDAYGGEIPKEAKLKIDEAIKQRDEALAEKEKLEKEITNIKAQKEVSKKAKRSNKSHEDFVNERKSYAQQLREAKEKFEKDQKDRGIQKMGAGPTLTPEMVKIVGKIVKSYVEEGINKLDEIVSKVHADVKDAIEGISKTHIVDIIAGRYNPNSSKSPLELNNDWVKANQKQIAAEFQLKQIKRKAFESSKNFYQKALMWAGRGIRLSVLSGTNVLYKLASAAAIGGALKRLPEEAIGEMYHHIFTAISDKAPIEGGGINVDAELKFYKEFFSPKKFAVNSLEILKKGESLLSQKYGKGGYEHIPILYLPTDLHQIIKDPLKRATFEGSFRKAMTWAANNNLDIQDPLVINSMETASYKRAMYEIFQEDNALSKKFTGWKEQMEKKGWKGATAKFVADFLIPVSTVPTNIVKRVASTSPLGLIRGSGMVVDAYRKGIERLKPEEADAVMRQLKQGTLGTALWMIGWLGFKSFGGLYNQFDPDKKKNTGDLVSDEMSVDGHMIPKPVQHALPLEVIQFAATTRRIYEHYKEGGSGEFDAIYNAGMGAIGAGLKQVPIISTVVHGVEATTNPYDADKFKEDMKGRVVPQILKETGIVKKPEKPPKATGGNNSIPYQ